MKCLELWAVGPELALGLMCLLLVPLAGFVRGTCRSLPSIVARFGLTAALILTARMLPWPGQEVFCGTYAVDGFGTVFKLLIIGSALLALLPVAAYFRGRDAEPHAPVALTFATLDRLHAVQSMSEKGECWDNAVQESFFATLKTELELGKAQWGRAQTRTEVFEWIEVFYNRQRRHSALGYRSPAAFEEQATIPN
ncbi:hypothetical protein DESA109040_18490 [Deinococcus saxicola]